MSRNKAELLRRLENLAGSPSELAVALGVESSDATFRRALAEAVELGDLRVEGATRDRRYVQGRPHRVASGFGAAVDLGITSGVSRTEAFARMGALASRQKHPIGSAKEA